MSAGSGCPGSSLGLSEERGTIRQLLGFYVDLALFFFGLVYLILSRVIRTYLIARCTYIHTAYLLSIIQQLYHIALSHYIQLMCGTGLLDFLRVSRLIASHHVI
jgi:hypothetical protein